METFDDCKVLAVPYKNLTTSKTVSILSQMQKQVKDGKIISGISKDEAKIDIMEILRTHSLNMAAWERFIIILTRSDEEYCSNEDETDDFVRKARKYIEGQNAFSMPIIVDLSVVNSYWENKEIYPRKVALKRARLDASVIESNPAKRAEIDSYAKITEYIQELETMIVEATNTPPSQMAQSYRITQR